MTKTAISRRRFGRVAAAAAGASAAAPWIVGGADKDSANDKLNVAVVGVGGPAARVGGRGANLIGWLGARVNLVAFAGVFAPLMLISIIFGEIVSKFATGALVAMWRTRKEKRMDMEGAIGLTINH